MTIPRLDQRASLATLHSHERDVLCQSCNGALRIGLPGDAASLIVIGEEDIDDTQQLIECAAPLVVWIVIGIERKRESVGFELSEDRGQIRLELFVEKERREMEVPASAAGRR